ncbi:MAG TPA: nucleotidyl transferase AbiEii/AbiGii toxin family protein [Burkholderiales bacterium]|nr:nucleotidyl transferase AbiEii/AbiGii toxin family protein [Burkholderiales bacterium]
MAEERLNIWESLFQRALVIIDSVSESGTVLEDWSFGGGTVLMRRYRHRLSKDIDIFISDPQFLTNLTPRLNSTTESLTSHYIEQAGFLKLSFPEGEIDFVASGPLTADPTIVETIFGREIQVETSTEIIAKKVWHRGIQFTARDIFDLSLVIEKEPGALWKVKPILRDRRDIILGRIAENAANLREEFAALEIIEYRRSFDECVEVVRKTLLENDSN